MRQSLVAIEMLEERVAERERDRAGRQTRQVQVHRDVRRGRPAGIDVDEVGAAVAAAPEVQTETALPLERGNAAGVDDLLGNANGERQKPPALRFHSGHPERSRGVKADTTLAPYTVAPMPSPSRAASPA